MNKLLVLVLLFFLSCDTSKVAYIPVCTDEFDYSLLKTTENTYEGAQEICLIVYHCTAVNLKHPHTRQSLLDLFYIGFNWSKPGYRHWIDVFGVVHDLINEYNFDPYLEWHEITYGARGYNKKSIHIAYDGGRTGDTRTVGQKSSLYTLAFMYKRLYPNALHVPHFMLNTSGKTCPNYSPHLEYEEMLDQKDELIHFLERINGGKFSEMSDTLGSFRFEYDPIL